MSTPVRHVLGISGGKDSAALAIYLKNKYPDLEIDFYTCIPMAITSILYDCTMFEIFFMAITFSFAGG